VNQTEGLSVLSALGAAIWSVWTWSENQQKQRDIKRDQEAALYVNPFILAIEELQSQLYCILEDDELAFYKKEYPDKYEFGSPAAVEILYRLSQYFGWVHRTFRYGPYTKDPRVIELNRRIGETFEDRSHFPGDAFRFSVDERVSLGQTVVRRIGDVTAVLPVFEAIPLFQFEAELSDQQGTHAPLFQSKAVRSTLAAVDRADRAETLEGHERLSVLQNLLVNLVAYLESKEGFSVSVGERRRARIRGNHVVSPKGPGSAARILHQTRGRIRLKIACLKIDKTYAGKLQSLLATMENVRNVRINPSASSVIINYSPDIPAADFATWILKAIEDSSIC
jgi:hypothetical protein